MGNLARKIIDAVQNTMLDKLVAKLIPLLWIWLIWDQMQPERGVVFPLAAAVAGLGLVIGAWGLGALANRRPRPARPGPYDRLHETPPNGFAAWDEPPEGGLRPAPVMRRLVAVLGARSRGDWSVFAGFLLFFALGAAVWTLGRSSAGFWASVHPTLVETAARADLVAVAGGLLAVVMVRHWATEQRERLDPSPARPDSSLFAFILTGLCGVGMLAVLASLFDLPPWWGMVAGLALAVLAFVPPWRGRVADALFGKRDDPASSRDAAS